MKFPVSQFQQSVNMDYRHLTKEDIEDIKNGDYKLEGSVLSFSILNTTGFEFRDYPIYADLYDNGTYVYY